MPSSKPTPPSEVAEILPGDGHGPVEWARVRGSEGGATLHSEALARGTGKGIPDSLPVSSRAFSRARGNFHPGPETHYSRGAKPGTLSTTSSER